MSAQHETRIAISRRVMLRMSAAAVLGKVANRSVWAHPIERQVTKVVTISDGRIRGLIEHGVYTFRGIRYGAAPVAQLRFAPPQRPRPWTQVIDCLEYGNSAMQLGGGVSGARFPGTIAPALRQLMTSADDIRRQHEDCLFLNVWTSALEATIKRPVMVWLHGGGFSYGSGSWPTCDGHNLAKHHDVVVVTLNHRLNVFGYLYLGGMDAASASGNAGTLDLVAALHWVRDNIAQFGGDPGNVTIFGQSGGGAKVSTLLATPSARGLFHRAIIESGPALRVVTKEAAAQVTHDLVEQVGGHDIQTLQMLPAARLLSAAADKNPVAGISGSPRWGPVVDQVVLPAHPFDPIAPAQSADIPILIGSTTDEQVLNSIGFAWWEAMTADMLHTLIRTIYGDKSDALINAFRRLRPQDAPKYLYTDILTAGLDFLGSVTMAERKVAQHAAPVYVYLWEWGVPVDHGVLRAVHTAEVPFVFDNVEAGPLLLGAARSTKVLARHISTVWATFAKTGDPNARGSGLPRWPAYDLQSRAIMRIDLTSRVENDPYSEIRHIFRS